MFAKIEKRSAAHHEITYLCDVNFLEDLNEEQRHAVECTEGPVMIIAGAGSGKTRVLTYRIVNTILKGTDPFNILALTFTNKAAKEMKERIARIAGPEAAHLWMGTFHSVFAKILRFEHQKINYPANFTIYDTEDSINLIKDIIRSMSLDEKTLYKPSQVLHRISSAKNSLLSAEAYMADHDVQNEDKVANRPLMGSIYSAYETRCLKASAMDFDDLLYRTYLLLRDDAEVLYKYQNKFKYILVDEFQDTNFLQYSILKKLAARFQNICVVGDDAQSIYAFRGANIQNILSFEKDYPELQVFRLEQNYRSTQNIVNAANSIIEQNRKQIKKTVWTSNKEGDKIKLQRALTDNEEGAQVAQSIFYEKMSLQRLNIDFAILYRTNAQSRSMEEALRKMNIPYRIFGGLSFYKRKEIKDLLAYFRLAMNQADEEALKRIINYPPRGIGDTTIDKIIVAADEQKLSLWGVLEKIQSVPINIQSNTRSKLGDFATMVKSFAVELKNKNAFEAASTIASSCGLLKELFNDKSPEGVSRYENVQELLNAIKEFTESPSSTQNGGSIPLFGEDAAPAPAAGEEAPIKTLDLFMQDIALLTDADEKEDDDADRVSLMTIHAAKGLEFKHVFIVGLEENLFPSQFALNSREELEEERRLFYVAITRAEDKLTLSYALSRYRWGSLVGCEPSRFVKEIDQNFLDVVTPRAAGSASESTGTQQRSAGFAQQLRGNTNTRYTQRTPNQNGGTPAQKPSPAPAGNFKPINKAAPKLINEVDFKADDASLIQVGMAVQHLRFGSGKVINLEGSLPDTKATIQFDGQGVKQILLKFAKLQIIKD